jgi:hypothetical protein
MIALAQPAVRVAPRALGELARAVAAAAKAERAYYDGPIDPDCLDDLELFAARIDAEQSLTAALIAHGVAPEYARIMAEALA